MFALLVSLSPFAGADEPGYGVTGLEVAKLAGGVQAPAPAEGFYKTMGGPLSLPSTRLLVICRVALRRVIVSVQSMRKSVCENWNSSLHAVLCNKATDIVSLLPFCFCFFWQWLVIAELRRTV